MRVRLSIFWEADYFQADFQADWGVTAWWAGVPADRHVLPGCQVVNTMKQVGLADRVFAEQRVRPRVQDYLVCHFEGG